MGRRIGTVCLIALLWSFVYPLVLEAEMVLQSLPGANTVHSDWLPTLSGFATTLLAGSAAYVLVRAMRQLADYPVQAWIGVPLAQALVVLPGIVTVVTIAAGGHSLLVDSIAVTSGDGRVAPLIDQVTVLFTDDVLPAAIITAGAWLAALQSAREDKPRESA